MYIKWIGHSCFKLVCKNQSVVIDPYKDNSVPGLKDVREKANIVLCSHQHHDHNGIENIEVQEVENSVFDICKISSFHDDCNGNKRGLNTIHLISANNIKVAHLGDLGHMLSQSTINRLKNVDVLLVPVGGYFTIDYQQAYQLVKQIEPKIVIPMHYRTNKIGYDVIDTVDNFINCFKKEDVINTNCNSVTVDQIYHGKVVVLTL